MTASVDRVDCVVIGAGVVGLAVARALALQGREVMVLEAQDAIGTGTSSRNSEVVHAGIYYPAGSLKARLCVQGKGQLYAYCEARGVPYRRCGKLIVATSEAQREALRAIEHKARANGVDDLQWLERDAAQAKTDAAARDADLERVQLALVEAEKRRVASDAERDKASAAVAAARTAADAELNEMRELLDARQARRRPGVDDDHLAFFEAISFCVAAQS